MSRICIALPLLLVLGLARPSAAEGVSDARAHYLKAQSHYAVGEFVEAGEEYQTAYKLKNDPALLYNAAQSFRLGGKLDKALILYRNYLQFYPDEAAAPMVKTRIAELKEAIATSERAKTNPPTGPVPATPEPAAANGASAATSKAATPAQTALVAPATTSPTTPEVKKTPAYKKWWVWTIVGGVAAAGVGVGLGLGLSSSSQHLNPTLGDFGPGAHTASLVRF